jgi:hypothetical protein
MIETFLVRFWIRDLALLVGLANRSPGALAAAQLAILPVLSFGSAWRYLAPRSPGPAMNTTLETTADPSPKELAFLGERLSAFNDSDVGAAGRKALAVFVRDEHGAVVAGISGTPPGAGSMCKGSGSMSDCAASTWPAGCWTQPNRKPSRAAVTAP